MKVVTLGHRQRLLGLTKGRLGFSYLRLTVALYRTVHCSGGEARMSELTQSCTEEEALLGHSQCLYNYTKDLHRRKYGDNIENITLRFSGYRKFHC